jgi:hypothetical protein
MSRARGRSAQMRQKMTMQTVARDGSRTRDVLTLVQDGHYWLQVAVKVAIGVELAVDARAATAHRF